MNRKEYIDGCANFVARLVHEVQAHNAIGQFDINSLTEDVFVPILRELYGCPELRNQNEIRNNFPAIDLGCKKSRTSFQVTSDNTSEKVAKTLEGFGRHGLDKAFDQVYVLIIAQKQTSYTAKSIAREASKLSILFNPSEHIIDTSDILRRLKSSDTTVLESVYGHLKREFQKRDSHLIFREQLNSFLSFSRSKIEVEKNSKKYIPSIFVETHSAKEEMRLFANPLFFYRKIDVAIERIDYSPLNYLLKLSNQPTLQLNLETITNFVAPASLADLEIRLAQQEAELLKARVIVAPLSWKYKQFGKKYEPIAGHEAIWSIVSYKVESIATGIFYAFEHLFKSISLIRKKIFLVTGMAGQGKTNFVCDLIENQFRAFEIPCIFIPARELNAYPSPNRILGFISDNRFAPKSLNVHEYLELMNNVAKESGKPFLIAIDGINEVNALEEFNAELKSFCNAVCQYDYVKILLTCRSEFFDEKFSSLLEESFYDKIFRINDLKSKMSEPSKDRLLDSYLSHFKIAGTLTGNARDFLRDDLLLLRIFCERYEGTDIGTISDVYRGDLFEDYLIKKIEKFPEKIRARALATLFKIASQMLADDNFAKLSVRDFTAEEKEVVQRLIADDVVLRQELPQPGLLTLGELAISFTYDELRDFVIAYYLVHELSVSDLERFDIELSRLGGATYIRGGL